MFNITSIKHLVIHKIIFFYILKRGYLQKKKSILSKNWAMYRPEPDPVFPIKSSSTRQLLPLRSSHTHLTLFAHNFRISIFTLTITISDHLHGSKSQQAISHAMEALPAALTRSFSTSSDKFFDIETPPPEPYFEISEKMPHLKNPELVSAMRQAVSDVSESRSVLEALGQRPDHEALDVARSRMAEIDAAGVNSEEMMKDYKACKAVIGLDEMHGAYEKMLEEAEKRLERFYDAAVSGDEPATVEEEVGEPKAMMNEEVAGILKAAEAGKKAIEVVDLSGRKLKILPEAFGKLKLLVVLNLSYNKLEVRILFIFVSVISYAFNLMLVEEIKLQVNQHICFN